MNNINQYRQALKDIKNGNIDFGFMQLNNYLKDNPDSVYVKKIKFAICEYYLHINDYRDAIYKLAEYIRDYSDDKSIIFIKAMLYKALLEYKKDTPFIEEIKKSLFLKSLFLIFSESKSNFYISILNNTYKIVDYIDKIEIFKNNELFLKITP